MNYLKFKIEYLKTLVGLFFILSFLFSFWVYFKLAKYLHNSGFEYCETNFCLPLLQLGDFLPILISVLGLIVVVLSIDSWEDSQRYNEIRENFIKTKTSVQILKDELIMAHASKLNPWDNFKFISMLGKLSNSVEDMQELGINANLIQDVENDRGKFFECIKNYLSGNALSSDKDIKLATSSLIGSLQACLGDLDVKHKNFKL